jgi:hypothetical protein
LRISRAVAKLVTRDYEMQARAHRQPGQRLDRIGSLTDKLERARGGEAAGRAQVPQPDPVTRQQGAHRRGPTAR